MMFKSFVSCKFIWCQDLINLVSNVFAYMKELNSISFFNFALPPVVIIRLQKFSCFEFLKIIFLPKFY